MLVFPTLGREFVDALRNGNEAGRSPGLIEVEWSPRTRHWMKTGPQPPQKCADDRVPARAPPSCRCVVHVMGSQVHTLSPIREIPDQNHIWSGVSS